MYLLAKHPAIINALRHEIEESTKGKRLEFAGLQTLTYTKAALNEAMRIRPPVGAMMRKMTRDTKIDGFTLKADSLAIFSIYNVHHHPDLWPEPEHFNPERFLSNESRRLAFMPFGAGERVCIGNHFAMLESQLLLAMMVKEYDFELLAPNEAEIEMVVSIRPKGGIPARIWNRREHVS